ncbi:MAG: hypothetical protein JWM99_5251 [Verrucomicrobiales bacterium]|nr:hypothetical protein [Verrucomicrobiales bacterium]
MIKHLLALILAGIPMAWAKLTPEQIKSLPAPASEPAVFSRDIKPIFEASCIKCHGKGKNKGGFALDTKETFLKGGDSGPAVIVGNSAESYLVELVSGIDPDNTMPQKGSKLTARQVSLVRAWIDQGLSWDANINFAKAPPVNLVPRNPEIPPAPAKAHLENPVDHFVFAYFTTNHITPKPLVSDAVFARRAFLDIIGLLPEPKELEAFSHSRSKEKRAELVTELLGRKRAYAEHWLTFWNDALRNDYKGTGYIDGGRRQITDWLYSALATNLPYDRFVAQLINPTPESDGFSKGIVWRGVVNASQTPEMQAAQNISQVFMGVNLKCASCHDSFINDWALSDAYGLASVYSDGPLEMYRCDKPTGKKALVKFLYPELGEIKADAPKAQRLERLAQVVTDPKDGRLTRTIVNRVWAKLMGRGLIEPVDEMDNPAWSQDLLDWLASDLVEHHYDLKRTIGLIVKSDAYQLPAVPGTDQSSASFVFQGPTTKRLTAEQFSDALAAVTGVWPETPAASIHYVATTESKSKAALTQTEGPFAPGVAPRWIWNQMLADKRAAAETLYFRKTIILSHAPEQARAIVACDNSFKLYVNGTEVGSGNDFSKPKSINLTPHLKKGMNVIAIAATNDKGKPNDPKADQSNPAGLIGYFYLRASENVQKQKQDVIMDFTTDSSWLWSAANPENWNKLQVTNLTGWSRSTVLGKPDMAPWNSGKALVAAVSRAPQFERVRASLLAADPLMTALGRPNREQVITTRASAATTLQALELTNGSTLSHLLERGAEKLIQDLPSAPAQFTTAVYKRALGRVPTKRELNSSMELIGSPVQRQGVEDLLWAMAMLPEFQVIN